MRLAFRFLLVLPALVLAVWLNLFLTFTDPAVQTWAARFAAAHLSQMTGAEITIRKISLGLKLQVFVEGVDVSDLKRNQLLSIDRLAVVPAAYDFHKRLKLKSVDLHHPAFHMVKYASESDFNYQFLLDAFAGSSGGDQKTSAYPIEVDELQISDGRFSYIIEGRDTVPERQMDYNRLVVSDIHFNAERIFFPGDSISLRINSMSALEQCGLKIHQLTTDLIIGNTFVKAKNLFVGLDETNLDLDFTMNFSGIRAFNYFIDSVHMMADLRPSSLKLDELGYFSNVMFNMPNLVTFQGRAEGTVADFRAEQFRIAFGAATIVEADIAMRGLPDIYSTSFAATFNNVNSTVSDIEQFRIPTETGRILLPATLQNLGALSLRGKFDGTFNDFITRLSMKSDLGYLSADLVMRTNPLDNRSSYNANINTRQLLLGKLIADAGLPGKTTMALRLDGSGLTMEEAVLNVSGQISALEMPGVVFSDLDIDARLEEKNLTADAQINDSKLAFRLSGSADFNSEKPVYSVDLRLDTANLAAMGLMPGDSIFALSTSLNGQFSLTGEQDFIGLLSLSNTRLVNSNGRLDIRNIQLSALEDPFLERKLFLQSDILQLEAGGKFTFSQLGASFSQFLHHFFGNEIFRTSSDEIAEQDFYFNLRIKDISGLNRLFLPQFALSRNASLTGVYMSTTKTLQSTFFADTVNYSGITIHKPYALINASSDKLSLNLRTQELELYHSSDQVTPSLGLEQAKLNLDIANDSLLMVFNWQNAGQVVNRGSLTALLTAPDPTSAQFRILSSDIKVNDTALWFDQAGSIVLGSKKSYIENFGIHLGTSTLLVNGMLPRGEADTLSLDFKQWELSNLNFLLVPYGISSGGRVNGELVLANLDSNPAFFSNLTILNLQLNDESLGDARLMSTWSGIDNSIYVNAQIIHRGNVGSGRIFHLRGFYYPERNDDNISFNLQLENFRLSVLNSFLEGIVSDIEGFASGNIDIGGSLNKPEFKGQMGLYRTSFLIDYLNVRYSLQHEFPIEPGRIVVRELMLIDTANNRAVANGVITHNHLQNFFFDLRLGPQNLIALNTGPAQNELFYGTAVVSGEVLIRGPIENIDMGIRVITQRGTSIVIPIDLTTSVGTNDYISFVKEFNAGIVAGDPSRQRTVANTNFGINLETVVTPDASLRIYMPYNTGTLDARGNGNLAMGVNAAGEFTLNGEYILQSGQFNFTYENIIKRRFELIEGGRIAWAGDPYDATIDAKGVYRVKASLAGLGLDTTQSLGNRVNVDCIIHLQNNLFNPDIRFGFRFPNLDSHLEQSVFTVIDTTNDALMTQQMISLLVLGSFASSSGFDNFSISNSSLDVLSGQLSSWLSQISKDFDIGLYYRPGDQLSSDELEVALSTQLFNERVTIDGNFGMVNNRNTTQNASNLVGDFDINVKLTRDGRVRLRAYNHSNVNNWISANAFDRYSPYTQGVGFSFRQEFDRFNEIFLRRRKIQTNK
ncbi:MAG TPA: translocation/assembly module TamB domain-containing protein [Bacteroidales bacterium]|nr:translocation/assembly module TamB domain-containing protein [Bacteroidales bacterium]